jgi:hypothetical protein
MAVKLQHRRDTATNLAAFTPAQGEIVVDTTNNRMVVGDGATVGGWPAAKLSEATAKTTTVTGGTLTTFSVGTSPSGAAYTLNILEQLVSGLSGASVNATAQIPAGCWVVGCSSRVVTAITGATSFSVGYTGTTNAFGSLLGIAAGSTNPGVIGGLGFYSPTNLVLTSAGSNFTGGAVRLSLMYHSLTPATS